MNRYVPDPMRKTAAPPSLRRYSTPSASAAAGPPSQITDPAPDGTYTTAAVFAGIVTSRMRAPPSILHSLATGPRIDS